MNHAFDLNIPDFARVIIRWVDRSWMDGGTEVRGKIGVEARQKELSTEIDGSEFWWANHFGNVSFQMSHGLSMKWVHGPAM